MITVPALAARAARSLVAVFACLVPTTSAVSERDPWMLSAAEWRQDLHVLAGRIRRWHPDPYRQVSPAEFEREVRALDSAIPRLSSEQVVLGLMRIASLAGDGHTSVAVPQRYGAVPIGTRWSGDSVMVMSGPRAHRVLLGARLVAVEGRSIPELLALTRPYVPVHEGEVYARRRALPLMMTPRVLHGIGVSESPDSASYTFASDSVGIVTLRLGAGSQITTRRDREVRAIMQRDPRIAWALAPLWATRDSVSDAMYLRLRGYPGFLSYLRFSARVHREVTAARPPRLVVDLRGNGGGMSQQFSWTLLPVLRRARTHLPADALVVLVGPATYSAGIMHAVQLRREGALLLGEPTSSHVNYFGATFASRLTRSGLRMTVPRIARELEPANAGVLLPDVIRVARRAREGGDSLRLCALRAPSPRMCGE